MAVKKRRQAAQSSLELLLALAISAAVLTAALHYALLAYGQTQRAAHESLALAQLANLATMFRVSRNASERHYLFQLWQQHNQVLLPQANSHYACQAQHCHLQMHLYGKTRQLSLLL